MGADLIVAVLAYKLDEPPSYDAGREYVKTLDLEKVRELSEVPYYVGEGATDQEYRDWMVGVVDDLEEAMRVGYRDAMDLAFGDYMIVMGGGTSWGDSPGPTFEAINNVEKIPGLEEAMGFLWPRRTEAKDG